MTYRNNGSYLRFHKAKKLARELLPVIPVRAFLVNLGLAGYEPDSLPRSYYTNSIYAGELLSHTISTYNPVI